MSIIKCLIRHFEQVSESAGLQGDADLPAGGQWSQYQVVIDPETLTFIRAGKFRMT